MSGRLVLGELDAFSGRSLPFDFNEFNRIMTQGICYLKTCPSSHERTALISSLGCLMIKYSGDVSSNQYVDMWTRFQESLSLNEKEDTELRDFMLTVIQTIPVLPH